MDPPAAADRITNQELLGYIIAQKADKATAETYRKNTYTEKSIFFQVKKYILFEAESISL